MNESERYDATTIALHWLVAVLIVCQWASGQTIDWFAKGAPRVDARSMHLVIGAAILFSMAVRIWWRLRSGRRLPPANQGIWRVTAQAMHGFLYAAVVAVVAGGVTTELLRGDSFFGLIHLPKLGGMSPSSEHEWAERLGDLHGLGADLIMILALLHALAALFHHYVSKDGVLRRMALGQDARQP
ncbi:cytochrome b [Phenylobacterium montanum]|uniref:Cytochrome b/b6 domain-containing protein n=1 Tax=Phenylobacterium montanum TaxID=2823693 RepID=A0A975G1Y2_9CAUL|nr:cytochrome b/b6 domain-containing protein [Caulobacter sp. S6]QUD89284.1 cytochrome b/b6 domain-containing protein [Caulobacter sp. S6]